MITKVVLKNIKSHLDAVIELDAGFNVIAGETDEGKSTIFWALNWVLYNKPFGWNPKPWKHLKPGRESRVEIHFSCGTVVARVRTASKNFYEFNGEELSPQGGVPDKIEKFINMGPQNVQIQKDAFFLLNDTAGQAAREISKVANLEGMDEAMKEAASRVKKVKGNIKTQDKLLSEKDAEMEALAWVESAQLIAESLNTKTEGIENLTARVNTSCTLQGRCSECREQMKGLADEDCVEDAAVIKKQLTSALSLGSQIASAAAKKDTVKQLAEALNKLSGADNAEEELEKLIKKFSTHTTGKGQLDQVVAKLSKIANLKKQVVDNVSANCLLDLSDLNKRLLTLPALKEKARTIASKIASISPLRRKLTTSKEELVTLETEKKKLIDTMEVCPLCSTVLT